MGWNSRLRAAFVFSLLLIVAVSCTISYKFNGASIDYDKVKTITVETFPIKSAYVYAPLGSEFVIYDRSIVCRSA